MNRTLAALVAAAALVTGCTQQPAHKQVTVLAAASLTESFRTIAREYERAHPGVTVRLVFGASSTLARQATAGAPGDVIATASTSTIHGVKGVGRPVVFARNQLAIATPPSNPGKVRGIADLARSDLRIAVCAQQVPCGAAAQRAFTSAHITGRPDTYEQDVKAVLTKVELGEVDAGLVYRTDVRAAGSRVHGLAISPPIITDYPILALKPAGRDFVEFVLSSRGRAVLAAAGFDPP